MNLNKFKYSWQYFKVINGLKNIEQAEILEIINCEEQVDYQVTKFSLLPNYVVFGMFLLFLQSC